jgi:hypothetical protein
LASAIKAAVLADFLQADHLERYKLGLAEMKSSIMNFPDEIIAAVPQMWTRKVAKATMARLASRHYLGQCFVDSKEGNFGAPTLHHVHLLALPTSSLEEKII